MLRKQIYSKQNWDLRNYYHRELILTDKYGWFFQKFGWKIRIRTQNILEAFFL